MKTLFRLTTWTLLLLGSTLSSLAQQPGKYRVSFTDKLNSPYSISNPLAFLSQRAIDRRLAQGIPITLQDIPVNPSYIAGVQNTGVTVINRSKWFNSIVVTISSTPQHTLISALPYVSSVEYVAPLTIKSLDGRPSKLDLLEVIPQSPSLMARQRMEKRQGKLNASVLDYGMAANQAEMIMVDILHDAGYQGQGMVIAVIDAGFTAVNTLPVFDSLWMNGRILGAVDLAEPGANIFAAHSHGTMVLSIMGGNIPGQMVGTAPKASYWLLRSEIADSEYIVEEDNWVAAAEFADSAGVDVINSSLGYTEYWDPSQNHTYENMNGNTTRVTIGADIAAAKGIIVVNSAGNSGVSPWGHISAPSDGDSVIAVGAVDAFGTYASFSSRGPSYDGRVKPDVSAQGSGTVIADIWGSITAGSGTSFSSPVIAGATACLWQAAPSMSNMEVVQAIKQSAHQYLSPDSLLGYGIPDFAAAALILGSPRYENLTSQPSIFPNPFSTGFQIQLPKDIDGVLSITLFDVAGRIVSEQESLGYGLSDKKIYIGQLDKLKPGVYFLNILGEDYQYLSRVVKINMP